MWCFWRGGRRRPEIVWGRQVRGRHTLPVRGVWTGIAVLMFKPEQCAGGDDADHLGQPDKQEEFPEKTAHDLFADQLVALAINRLDA